jgi:urease accessory protein
MMLALRDASSLVSLLQLASPALPVGAFAFSQGLESAVDMGWITDEASARSWLEGALDEGLARLDLPILARLYRAHSARDAATFHQWSEYLLASRESLERRLEDVQLARALARLLADRGIFCESALEDDAHPHAALFAVAAVSLSIPLPGALLGFAFSWAENQVGALSRLVPLGQLAAQRVLTAIGALVPEAVSTAQTLSDAELGSCMPGLAVISALHETQYTRLFKS